MAAPAEDVRRRDGETGGAARVGAETSLTGLASTGLRSLTDLVGNFFELVALESRAAAGALVTSVGVVVAAVILALTAWGLLIGAAVTALAIHTGITAALLIVAAVNAVVAGGLALWIPALLRRLSFPSTRRAFRRGGA